jgi:hypothetical protein
MTTKSERTAKRILGGALAKSGWAFLMKIRLQDVLERDDLTKSDPEWTLYTTGHFDFVVCHTSDDVPVFALEIDGPSHQTPRQISLDIIKNRLCAAAGLPLLRLGLHDLDETAESSILEWLVERFVSWEEQSPEFRADGLSPVVHHVASAFPGNLAASTQLFNEHGIAVVMKNAELFAGAPVFGRHWLVQAWEAFGDKAPHLLEVEWPGPMPSFEDGEVSEFMIGKVQAGLIARRSPKIHLLRTTGEARFAWAHKTQSTAVVQAHALIPTAEQVRALGLFAPSLPWLDASSVADELAIYDALVHVERWARATPGSSSRVTT